jgi:hypothetical protein
VEGRLTPTLLVAAALACGGSDPETDVPPVAAPIPTAGMAGQEVTLYPLTLVVSDPALGWAEAVGPRADALATADSLLATFLTERVPEVTWILPTELRRAAGRAPGMLPDPDKMSTAILRGGEERQIPDPLRSQMRNLTGMAGDRYAFVPASLVFVPGDTLGGRAELTVAIADVRMGLVQWRTVARAEGDDPWAALRRALSQLVPDVP